MPAEASGLGGGQPVAAGKKAKSNGRGQAPRKPVGRADARHARLKKELDDSLAQQAATAEILALIRESPSDTRRLFQAIAARAARLCEASDAVILMREGDGLRWVAHHGDIPGKYRDRIEPLNRGWVAGRAVLEARQIHVPDLRLTRKQFPVSSRLAREFGHRAIVATPILRGKQAIGVFSIRRMQAGRFGPRQLGLVRTFADQAAIAIQNLRLINDTREALERQTATAEILKVIARSPSDIQPVCDTIAERAMKICGGMFANVLRFDGTMLHFVSSSHAKPEFLRMVRRLYPMRPDKTQIAGRTVLARAPARVEDAVRDPHYLRRIARVGGLRRMLGVPMLRDGDVEGVIVVGWDKPGPISWHHEELLKTFADQAVIAIENVRLFNETKEALERQTATAEVLRVISSSPSDLEPVYRTILENILRLCDSHIGALFLYDGEMLSTAATLGTTPEMEQQLRQRSFAPSRMTPTRLAALERRVVHVPDLLADAAFSPQPREVYERESTRTVLSVPMLREGAIVGVITTWRREVRPFDDRQVALIKTFADQAVIAIENVRLFNELKQRTEALAKSVGQLQALGEVGQAISSTLDLETVLRTIVSRALQLTGLDGGTIYEYDEASQEFRVKAAENIDQAILEIVRATPGRLGEGAIGRAGLTREPAAIPDILDQGYQARLRDPLIRAGYRALLAVPLLRDEHLLGALVVNRKAPGAFAPEVVELLKTFATQSAMAIQNARLFREIEEKGKQLEVASQHKSQFLASMSHELRTPLNAILGFNEMIISGVYGDPPEDMKEPLSDIQTSGKHLLRLINNVLDLAKIEAGRMELALSDYSVQDTVESVRSTLRPLAAEKGLEFLASVPADLPLAYGDSGRITQCLMNLAGNSLKFTKQGKVEIAVEQKDGLLTYRVTDTGIGIPPEKIGSLFTEFKQTDATIASEYGGTGLGLSITRKFIEMHGGRIWVESEPGKGSSFIFELPLRVQGE
jgi:signal transduction histidine kinase